MTPYFGLFIVELSPTSMLI